jgi:MoaA/NifB/PqqE/SkfB family radical SAM enzyme
VRLSSVPSYARSYLSHGPSYVILYVTSRCNQKCEFCFYADSLNAPWGDGLSIPEIEKIARSLKNCVHMTLTGGETFVREDLVDVVRILVRYAGTRNVTFATNGSLTERVLTAMETLCQEAPAVDFRIALSIDALGEKHDAIRVMKGAFSKAEETFHGLKALQKSFGNLHLVINSVASKYNKGHLKEFIDYAVDKLWCDDHTLLLARGITKQGDAKDITASEYHDLVHYLERRKAEKHQARTLHSGLLKFIETETRAIVNRTYTEDRFQIPCVAGNKLVIIYDSGDVYPCEIIDTLEWSPDVRERFGNDFKLGNVRDYDCDVRKILSTERAREIQRFIIDSKCYCTFECAVAASIVFNPKTLVRTVLSPPSKRAPGPASGDAFQMNEPSENN